MTIMLKQRLLSIILVSSLMVTIVWAGDDPSIKGNLRLNIQTAMGSHVNQNTIQGDYIMYDAVKGELKKLKLTKLHSGIVKKGNFFVSCADFEDQRGKAYDIDFLVAENI